MFPLSADVLAGVVYILEYSIFHDFAFVWMSVKVLCSQSFLVEFYQEFDKVNITTFHITIGFIFLFIFISQCDFLLFEHRDRYFNRK